MPVEQFNISATTTAQRLTVPGSIKELTFTVDGSFGVILVPGKPAQSGLPQVGANEVLTFTVPIDTDFVEFLAVGGTSACRLWITWA